MQIDRIQLISRISRLIDLHKSGALGGEKMPEDANPNLARGSSENLLYFTLPMSLNFQRNSYKLWEGAHATFLDDGTRFVFDPRSVASVSDEELRFALLKYKVALQPKKHVEIWRRICVTFLNQYRSDVRDFLESYDFRIGKILEAMHSTKKPDFPYLSGPKISNYWLYVLTQYTDMPLVERNHLSVAPDTHVIQASIKLGLIHSGGSSSVQSEIARSWADALSGTGIHPIDIHTPMWLWSRQNFQPHV